jgi:MoaA/NifB/PqqE/SkfB family radical SAM enzyme
MNELGRFRDSFLDYIPEPSMGRSQYEQSLEQSFEADEAKVPPLYALLKVTERCNSKCVYCAHSRMHCTADEVTSEKLWDVLNQLADVGVVSVNFTGGEPLLRKDVPQLVAHARDLGMFPILLTNGLLLSERSEELRGNGLGMVIVSVDSIRPECYRATRGVPEEPVLAGIDAVLAWRPEERPVINATVVVSSANLYQLDEIVDYFEQRGVGVEFTPYHHNGRWEDDYLSPHLDMPKYEKVIDRLCEMKSNGKGILNSFAYLKGFRTFSCKRALPDRFKCYCGYTTIFIDPELNVRSCWSEGMPIAGNLYRHSLSELLGGARMRIMRSKIRELKCERCWLLCTAEISARFQR